MTTANDKELVLTRVIDASPEKLFRCWTNPELLKKWFAPRPWTTPSAELDVRAGGASVITMRSPEGQDMPNAGVYLEVVPNKKLVFTDAFTAGWVPAGEPFMTVEITFEPAEGGKTLYTAKARHWTTAACERHAKMGFHVGWGICTTQLEELAKSL